MYSFIYVFLSFFLWKTHWLVSQAKQCTNQDFAGSELDCDEDEFKRRDWKYDNKKLHKRTFISQSKKHLKKKFFYCEYTWPVLLLPYLLKEHLWNLTLNQLFVFSILP